MYASPHCVDHVVELLIVELRIDGQVQLLGEPNPLGDGALAEVVPPRAPFGQQVDREVAQLDLDPAAVDPAREVVAVDAGVGPDEAGVEVVGRLAVRVAALDAQGTEVAEWSVPDSIDTGLGCQVGESPES